MPGSASIRPGISVEAMRITHGEGAKDVIIEDGEQGRIEAEADSDGADHGQDK